MNITARRRFTRRRFTPRYASQFTRPPRPVTVVVELEQISTGIHSAYRITPGDTLQVTVNGYMTIDGQPRAVVEFPVRIRASVA